MGVPVRRSDRYWNRGAIPNRGRSVSSGRMSWPLTSLRTKYSVSLKFALFPHLIPESGKSELWG